MQKIEAEIDGIKLEVYHFDSGGYTIVKGPMVLARHFPDGVTRILAYDAPLPWLQAAKKYIEVVESER